MKAWQLQEAKAKFSQLVKEAQNEPQAISRHGKEEAVIISMKQYKDFTDKPEDIVSFFNRSPLKGLDLEFERDPAPMRDIDFDFEEER